MELVLGGVGGGQGGHHGHQGHNYSQGHGGVNSRTDTEDTLHMMSAALIDTDTQTDKMIFRPVFPKLC